MARSDPSVILLLGKERFLKEEVIREIRSRWIRDDFQKGFNDTVFRGKEAPLSEIIDTVHTMPMMGEKRVVTVLDFDENKQAKDLFTLLPAASDTAVLLLVSSEGEFYRVLDKRFQARFTGVYGEQGLVRNFYDMRPAEVKAWISAAAGREGRQIEPEAVDKLMETAGSNLSDLYQEIRKMMLYEPERKVFTAEDVSRIVSRDLDASTDAVRNAVLRRDAAAALKEFRRFTARFGRNECLPLLGDLVRQFRLLSQAHEAVRMQGLSITEIGMRPEFGLKHPAVRERFLSALRIFSEGDTDRALLLFYPMDRILKSRKDGEVKVYFERFLLSLCGRNRGRQGKRQGSGKTPLFTSASGVRI